MGKKFEEFDDVDGLIEYIRKFTEDLADSGEKHLSLNYHINLKLNKLPSHLVEIVFSDIECTTSNFTELKTYIVEHPRFRVETIWGDSPAVEVLTSNYRKLNIKFQCTEKDLLKLNFYDDCDLEYIYILVDIILSKYYDSPKPSLVEEILKLAAGKHIEIYEDVDYASDRVNWDLIIYGNVRVTCFCDVERKFNYINLMGFYVARDIDEFQCFIKKIFKDQVKIELSSHLDLALTTDVDVLFEDATQNFRINFINPGVFSIQYEDEQLLLESRSIEFIEGVFETLRINLGGIQNQRQHTRTLNIGLINEFGFPLLMVKNYLKEYLHLFGYNPDNIVFTNIEDLSQPDLTKINIIENIAKEEHFNKVKQTFSNKVIFISCGLKHGFHSVSEQKLIKAYICRIEKANRLPTRKDYQNLNNNLYNKNLVDLQDSINKIFCRGDFFLSYDSDRDLKRSKYKIKQQLKRLFYVIHGHPFITPTMDEFMIHTASAISLRTADLSKQAGAVIATKLGDIIATGANEVPKRGGGTYWAHVNLKNHSIFDDALGRDYIRGFDSNVVERKEVIKQLLSDLKLKLVDNKNKNLKKMLEGSNIEDVLEDSILNDNTEYGRVIHAGMEAIMACARNKLSTIGTTLYSTTFPCHNCAKHIIAAGIDRVVYMESSAKSKAFPFHLDSIVDEEDNPLVHVLQNKARELHGETKDDYSPKVSFERFIGIGPNIFKEVFKMKDEGRKNQDGTIKEWKPKLLPLWE